MSTNFLKKFKNFGSTPKKLLEHGSCGSGEWFSPSPFFRRLKGLRPKGEGGESGLRRKQPPQYANGPRISLSPWKT